MLTDIPAVETPWIDTILSPDSRLRFPFRRPWEVPAFVSPGAPKRTTSKLPAFCLSTMGTASKLLASSSCSEPPITRVYLSFSPSIKLSNAAAEKEAEEEGASFARAKF